VKFSPRFTERTLDLKSQVCPLSSGVKQADATGWGVQGDAKGKGKRTHRCQLTVQIS